MLKANNPSAGAGGPLTRRRFVQGVSLSAAAGALFYGGMAVGRSRAMSEVFKAPAMIFARRTSSLSDARRFVDRHLRIPHLWGNSDADIYDAGSVLLMYSVGGAFAGSLSESPFTGLTSTLNPSSSLVLTPEDYEGATAELRKGLPSDTPKLSFLDSDGNYFAARRMPYDPDASDRARQKIQAVRSAAARLGGPSAVTAISLLVSDVSASTAFYQNALGLTPLYETPEAADFVLGAVVLSLRMEPTRSLVRFLRTNGQLAKDRLIVAVADSTAAAEALQSRGAWFHAGLYSTPLGAIASFSDPDGYSLGLWAPDRQSLPGGVARVVSRLEQQARIATVDE